VLEHVGESLALRVFVLGAHVVPKLHRDYRARMVLQRHDGEPVIQNETLEVVRALGGLQRRARLDRNGEDESRALAPLVATVATGHSPSDRLLAAYHGPWAGDIDRIFDTQAL
jgi:gamma-glutamylcysteine synthetase